MLRAHSRAKELFLHLPVSGHPLHTRALTVAIWLREDRRWQAKGQIIDLRKCSFAPLNSDIQPAGLIHDMTLTVCFDPAECRIDSIETAQPVVAIEPSELTRGECCRDPAPQLQSFVGQRVDAEFPRKLSLGFGGPRGCTHLLTLFQLLASTLRRAVGLEQGKAAAERLPEECLLRRSAFVDGFELADGTIELGVQLADFLTLPRVRVKRPLDRLARQFDARVYARVEGRDLALRKLQAAQRERDVATLLTAPWQDRASLLEGLEGRSIMGGFGGQVVRRIGDDPDTMLLRDALLQLAPGYVQVLGAVLERAFGAAPDDPRTQERVRGGRPDSCYMWRSGGPLLEVLPPGDREG